VPSVSHLTREETLNEPSSLLRATRVVGNEKWQAEVLLTEQGVAIGYTGPRISRSGRKRVMLGFAMGYIKDDDFRIEY
jgi:hypothetical protein